jgi:hypothetical protein
MNIVKHFKVLLVFSLKFFFLFIMKHLFFFFAHSLLGDFLWVFFVSLLHFPLFRHFLCHFLSNLCVLCCLLLGNLLVVVGLFGGGGREPGEPGVDLEQSFAFARVGVGDVFLPAEEGFFFGDFQLVQGREPAEEHSWKSKNVEIEVKTDELSLLTFRELIVEAEDLQRVDRDQLQVQVSGEERVEDATERHQQLLFGFDLVLLWNLAGIAALRERRLLQSKLSVKAPRETFYDSPE